MKMLINVFLTRNNLMTDNKKPINLRLPEDRVLKIKAEAKANYRTVTKQVLMIIDKYYEEQSNGQ
jgi:hypothetical protein